MVLSRVPDRPSLVLGLDRVVLDLVRVTVRVVLYLGNIYFTLRRGKAMGPWC